MCNLNALLIQIGEWVYLHKSKKIMLDFESTFKDESLFIFSDNKETFRMPLLTTRVIQVCMALVSSYLATIN